MSQNKSLVSIAGPTATGKTGLALYLGKQIIKKNQAAGVCLISADSRQVYRDLEILTGADIPQGFKKTEAKSGRDFFKHQKLSITLHGVSIINPDEEWSVTHFRNMAIKLIKTSWKNNWVPIIVGGTGLYHKQLFNNDPELYISPNQKIRSKAENKSTQKLQKWLKEINPDKFQGMNQSDKNNPRRLVRAIEVAQTLSSPSQSIKQRIKNRPKLKKSQNNLAIGLKLPLNQLENKIKHRVKQRFMLGAIKEVESLLKLNLDPKSPAMTATGVRPIKKYLQNKITAQKAIKSWTLAETQYAKRQLTWWGKYQEPNWLDPSQSDYQQKAWGIISKALNL